MKKTGQVTGEEAKRTSRSIADSACNDEAPRLPPKRHKGLPKQEKKQEQEPENKPEPLPRPKSQPAPVEKAHSSR